MGQNIPFQYVAVVARWLDEIAKTINTPTPTGAEVVDAYVKTAEPPVRRDKAVGVLVVKVKVGSPRVLIGLLWASDWNYCIRHLIYNNIENWVEFEVPVDYKFNR